MLHIATKLKRFGLVRKLIENGTPLHLLDYKRETVLHYLPQKETKDIDYDFFLLFYNEYFDQIKFTFNNKKMTPYFLIRD